MTQEQSELQKSDNSDLTMYAPTTSKVRYGQHSLIESENWYSEDWQLPARGEEHLTCEEVTAKVYCPGCGTYKHELTRSCYRAECPVCYKKWIARETKVASERVFQGLYQLRDISKKYLLHHVVWSVPPSEYHLSYQEQRKRFHYRRKVAGSIAGLMIYHPWRFRAVSDGREVGWRHCSLNPDAKSSVIESYALYSPHFHTLSVGYLMNAVEFEKRFGWVYVKLHQEVPIWSHKDMKGVIWYQLSHAGISSKFHALSWYGKLSNNQFVLVSTSYQYLDMKCPDCGAQLEYHLCRMGIWSKSEDWVTKITKRHYKFKDG